MIILLERTYLSKLGERLGKRFFIGLWDEELSSSGSVEGLDHHSLLAFISHQHAFDFQNGFQCLEEVVESAGSSFLLCKSSDAEMVLLAMFDNSHDFDSERNFLHIEDCVLLAMLSLYTGSGLTVLSSNSRKHDISFLVDLDVPNAITLPIL